MMLRLEKNNTDENPLGSAVSEEEGSWIIGMVSIGAVVGSLISGSLGEW